MKGNRSMGKKKEDRPYFDENRDYVGEHEAEIVRPLSRNVVVQEKLVVQTLRKNGSDIKKQR